MKEKMISSGKKLYKGFNQFRSSKFANSPLVMVPRIATDNNEDLSWADLNDMESMILQLEHSKKLNATDFNALKRCSSWVSDVTTPGGVIKINEEPIDEAYDQTHGDLLLAPPPKIKRQTQNTETKTVPDDTAIAKIFPESVQKNSGELSDLYITEEAMYQNFVNLIGIHELLYDCRANEIYKPLNPLINHLRRRLLAILRFCFDSEKGDMVLTSLQHDETWFSKGFSKKSLCAAISDIKWASSSTYFKQHKMQVQLDVAAGPFSIFEEIQAVRTMAKAKC